MTSSVTTKPWSVEQRLEFIEFTAYWEGELNRSTIVSRFGVSPQQASGDLSAYQALAPENLQYDLRAKRYTATPGFRCHLIEPDADRYLGQLTAVTTRAYDATDTWLDGNLAADVIPSPARRVQPDILREMLAVVRAGQSVEVRYQSLNPNAPVTVWRRITPHAFGSDGFRWHVRAFCHRDKRFKDFLLSRCSGMRDEAGAGAAASEDRDWSEYFDAMLIANPRLSTEQRRAIEVDYAMTEGFVKLSIRYALLYYFHKRLGADFAPTLLDADGEPRETPIVIENLSDYITALGRVGVRKR